jgi:hypothetical protein
MCREKDALNKEICRFEQAEPAKGAEDMLRSLESTDYGQLSPAWEEEILRRLRAVDDGSAELFPGDEVFRQIETELRARRGCR